MKFSMTCTCGDVMTVDAVSREEAVQKFKDMMTEDAIKKHMEEKHWTKNPSEPMPTVEQAHMMIEQTTKQVN